MMEPNTIFLRLVDLITQLKKDIAERQKKLDHLRRQLCRAANEKARLEKTNRDYERKIRDFERLFGEDGTSRSELSSAPKDADEDEEDMDERTPPNASAGTANPFVVCTLVSPTRRSSGTRQHQLSEHFTNGVFPFDVSDEDEDADPDEIGFDALPQVMADGRPIVYEPGVKKRWRNFDKPAKQDLLTMLLLFAKDPRHPLLHGKTSHRERSGQCKKALAVRQARAAYKLRFSWVIDSDNQVVIVRDLFHKNEGNKLRK